MSRRFVRKGVLVEECVASHPRRLVWYRDSSAKLCLRDAAGRTRYNPAFWIDCPQGREAIARVGLGIVFDQYWRL